MASKSGVAKKGGKTRREIVAQITARAWTDKKFKKRFLTNPKEVLAEYGLAVPEGLEIVMHEDSLEVEHGVLLAPPEKLSPKELGNPKNVHFPFCFTDFHHHKHPKPGK